MLTTTQHNNDSFGYFEDDILLFYQLQIAMRNIVDTLLSLAELVFTTFH